MKENFTTGEWVLSHYPKMNFSKPTPTELRDMKQAGVLKRTDGNVPYMLRSVTKFPALPIPIEVKLRFCQDFLGERGEKVSIYTNLLCKEIREEKEEASRQPDEFYAVYTDSELHEKVKALGNKRFWLSRFYRMREGEKSLYITTTHGEKEICAPIISAIYKGEGSPPEQLWSNRDIIRHYGKIVMVQSQKKKQRK